MLVPNPALTLPGKMPFWKERLPGLRKQFTSMTPEVFSPLAKNRWFSSKQVGFQNRKFEISKIGSSLIENVVFLKTELMVHGPFVEVKWGGKRQMYIYLYLYLYK